MAFKYVPPEKRNEKLEELRKQMATMDDLFGTPGQKSAPTPKWNEVGDTHSGVVTEEPSIVDERDWKSKKAKFFVKTGGGPKGWELKLEGDFDTNLQHNKCTQIKVPVKLANGEDATFYFSGQKRDALKDAMQESGEALVVGVTIAVRLVEMRGQKKVYAVKMKTA